ncbi:hypothetical protein DITRI_Ditri20bG0042000 [Diplodiscus trichospermus]
MYIWHILISDAFGDYCRHHKLNYQTTPGDEVEDMFVLLKEVKKHIPSVTAVSSGAIASDYQRLRVESVCSRLGLVSLAYLWKQDQSLLLQEMITNSILAITVKVAAMGLDPAKHLGKEIAFLKPYLHKLKDLYGINVCGEGGEYETLTLDCPLFHNGRIMLDEFQVVLHSSDSIAPVGVLHPLQFHLEKKASSSLSDKDKANDLFGENMSSVFEVQGENLQECKASCKSVPEVSDLVEVSRKRLHLSKTEKDNTFSICCWLQDSSEPSAGLQEDLKLILRQIELQLQGCGFGWEHVLYIHLYMSDMNQFTLANETYVRFITQDKCPFGVPSRSTIELPLIQAGLGNAYIEVLVANDQSKRVLHVQSISCWAPSCIGPYSQATLHKEILHMAGQLGLDPPTMTLSGGGSTAELEQALQNSEAIAECFNCSISTSAILFVVYCSTNIPSDERPQIHDKLDTFIKQDKPSHLDKGSKSEVLDPIFLYVLVPDLPKRALVEVKPVLYVPETAETTEETSHDLSGVMPPSYYDFQRADWHDSCIQKCVIHGKICAVVLSITSAVALKVCSDSMNADWSNGNLQNYPTEGQMRRISRFCIYLLDKIVIENDFSWRDIMSLRIYVPPNPHVPLETLLSLFTDACKELDQMCGSAKVGGKPIFNLVPVLGSGRSAACTEDIITCELFARKS